ncbi:MAG: hypothetical protein ACRD3V_05020 [Vicinamibacteria bacterium]
MGTVERALSMACAMTWSFVSFPGVTLHTNPGSFIQEAEAVLETEDRERSGQQDFDFFIGRWKIQNRRLRERLKGSNEWDEFEGTSVARPLWGGRANIDEYEGDGPAGPIYGLTLRLYDPKTKQWSLHWSNSANGTLDKAMIGRFENGRGEFYNEDTFEGRSIFVRFIWSVLTPISCRWEQAFSADGGKTWETNWIMDFTRVP